MPRGVLHIQMQVSSQELDIGVQNSGQRFRLRHKPGVVSIFITKRLDEIIRGLMADRKGGPRMELRTDTLTAVFKLFDLKIRLHS